MGLLGGKWEYNPYMTLYTSFGKHRVNSEKDFLRLRGVSAAAATNHTRHNDRQIKPDIEAKPEKKKTKKEKKEKGDEDEKDITEVIMEREPLVYQSYDYTVELDDYDKMRGDDAIKFKLFCFTRFSGVTYLDALESDYVEREISEGLFHIELIDLFRMYLKNERKPFLIIDEEFVDDKIVMEKIKTLANTEEITIKQYNTHLEHARQITKKANVKILVRIHNFNDALYQSSIFAKDSNLKKTGMFAHLSSFTNNKNPNSNHHHHQYTADNRTIGDIMTKRRRQQQQQPRQAEFQCMLYNSEKAWQKMGTSMYDVLNVYCDYFIKMSNNHTPRHQPSEPHISNLQLLLYNSENGKLPVYCYWSNHEPFFRQYSSKEAREEALKLYPLTQKSEDHLLLMLRSSLRRHGICMKRFVQAIRNHFSASNKSLDIESDFIVAEEVIAQIGTFAANQAYYTADYRFMNVATNATANAAKSTRSSCSHCGKLTVKVLNIDSWDNNIMNDTSMCDDCEGMGNVVSTIIRTPLIGRYELDHQWDSDALKMIMLYLQYTNIFDVGALVTSIFMNTDNTKVELQQSDDLPRIGSTLDNNAKNDGHCFNLTQSQQKTLKMMRNGNLKKDLIQKVATATYISDEFAIREEQRQTLVLEPTGSIEPRILSVVESYKKYPVLLRKKKAEVLFMRKMRAIVKEDQKKYEAIITLFNGEGMPHYIEEQPTDIRASSFYNSIVHSTSVDLLQRFDDISLAQYALCKDIKGAACYGVRMGEFLRDHNKTKLSLISPFINHTEEWEKNVAPMIETIQNQMPIQRFGRYTDKQYREDIYSIFVRIDEIDPTFLFKSITPLTRKASKETSQKQEDFESDLDSLGDDQTVVRLYSRAWKMDKNTKDRADLLEFIQSIPGIVSMGIYIEKHLPVCEPIILILCIIDVEKASK